ERLMRMEEKCHIQEDENEKLTRQIFLMENDLKHFQTTTHEIPYSRDYERFTTIKNNPSISITPRLNDNLVTERYSTYNSHNSIKNPPSSPDSYSRIRQQNTSTKNGDQYQLKHAEHMEHQFDQLMGKKRDLESRLNRIPTRGLSTNDKLLFDYLENELSNVEKQISSVKLELRKMHILKTTTH
ncbi:unnamed protein product, partial [Didymodactylos carnosus]